MIAMDMDNQGIKTPLECVLVGTSGVYYYKSIVWGFECW